MHLDPGHDGILRLLSRGSLLMEYVYRPADPPIESPRPFARLWSRSGEEVTAHRPADHVWHKGLSLALPAVGPHNFWGGPTYVHPEGYVQLPNNGAQVHREFLPLRGVPVRGTDVAGFAQLLEWIAEDGQTVLRERRTVTARELDDETWAITWRSALRNTTPDALAFGSPTTKGRHDAGYAGIFWRGPVAFTGGDIVGPSGAVGEAARGAASPWLAFVAERHGVGLLMLDAGDGPEPPWFARSAEYAGLNPAPFFREERLLGPGDELVLGAVVVIGGTAVVARFDGVGAALAAEMRADSIGVGRQATA